MADVRIRERWDFRVTREANDLVREAAAATDRSLTEFVVEAATVEAERVLADRTRFSLDESQWKRFSELLDRPPQENLDLAKLFARPDVFE
ncbi:MAG: DUF1778 domain-containing protein [Gaiellaceae bacterium MAG52_C11]|nr:DUF1778 domain-containing protein [Candidatus Gaiellasilicea maunaloa]